jgi:intracellular sulfur oxidation DsrE/DsrF family protein
MASYLLIESRDPFTSGEVGFCQDLSRRLVAAGDEVTVFLVENGVLPARSGAAGAELSELVQAGVEVLVDDFSLRERGIPLDRLRPGIKPAAIDLVIDRLAAGCKAIWH